MPKKFRVLFVCLGNICRSPAAEGVLRHLAGQRGLQDRVEVDSAGTGDWHCGDLPDARMRQHAARRGYDLSSRARQVRPEDFAAFDLILVMDRQNRQDLREFVRREFGILGADGGAAVPRTMGDGGLYGSVDELLGWVGRLQIGRAHV